MDASWPSIEEWNALNKSIHGTLIQTAPAASACYAGNPFNVSNSCAEARKNWNYAEYQASLPEGIDSRSTRITRVFRLDLLGIPQVKGVLLVVRLRMLLRRGMSGRLLPLCRGRPRGIFGLW